MLRALYSGEILIFVFFLGICLFPGPIRSVAPSDKYRIHLHSRLVNHAPVVKINQPSRNGVYTWNAMVPYSIDITDSEDGDSRYDEIASNEVIVRLKFVPDAVKASGYLKQKKFGDTTGLSAMLVSNCFNCHGVKTKLAGPSFQEISRHYKLSDINRNQLVNHIRNGSSGIWGKEVMPTHPELTDSAAGQMVRWILNYTNDPGLNYLIGLKGALPLNKPSNNLLKGIYVMTAFYTDHGTADFPDKRISGSDQLMLQVK